MAEKRMFSKTVIDSDDFLDMPLTAQALYFHLAMRADDDGFINNPKSIMRNTTGSKDDLKMLEANKFIICFDSGIVAISHWKIHNYIRKDRYNPTKCQEEMSQLLIEENGRYTICQPNDNQRLPQIRLGEDSIGKVSSEGEKEVEQTAHSPVSNSESEYNSFGKYKHVLLTDEQYSALINDFGKKRALEYIDKVDSYCQQKGATYNDYDLTVRKWLKEDRDNSDNSFQSSFDLGEFDEFTLNNVPKIESNKQEKQYGGIIL